MLRMFKSVIAYAIGGLGVFFTLKDIPFLAEGMPYIIAWIAVFICYGFLIVESIWRYIENALNEFSNETDTFPRMAKVLKGADPTIFTKNISFYSHAETRKILEKKAREGDLTLYIPRMVPAAENLQREGATVVVYGDERFDPSSRFTIIGETSHDQEMLYGYKSKNGKFILKKFRASDDEPAFYLASDVIKLLKLYNRSSMR